MRRARRRGWSQSSHEDYGLRSPIMPLGGTPRRVAAPRTTWRASLGAGWELPGNGRVRRTSIYRVSNPVLLVYSNRPEVRERIMTAIGRRPAPDVGRVDYLECSAVYEVMMATQAQLADVLILDG